jgi:FtsP/CotA-like multicopper oxidase with cupredoxin domain
MRVYLPSTLPLLAQALQAGVLGPSPQDGFAVTPALREAYASGDEEELEYAAMTAAARASLRLLEPEDPSRRVVLAAEIPAESVHWTAGDPAAVTVTAEVPVAWVASGHVDGAAAEPDVAAAAAAVEAADAGDDDAAFTVDGAEGHELLWYATQELTDL